MESQRQTSLLAARHGQTSLHRCSLWLSEPFWAASITISHQCMQWVTPRLTAIDHHITAINHLLTTIKHMWAVNHQHDHYFPKLLVDCCWFVRELCHLLAGPGLKYWLKSLATALALKLRSTRKCGISVGFWIIVYFYTQVATVNGKLCN